MGLSKLLVKTLEEVKIGIEPNYEEVNTEGRRIQKVLEDNEINPQDSVAYAAQLILAYPELKSWLDFIVEYGSVA